MAKKKAYSLQRVIQMAADAFLTQRFENVSVSKIAEAAHCSTTTIYEVFGNKQGLFADAMAYVLSELQSPTLVHVETRATLKNLLLFSESRVRHMSNVRVRLFNRAVIDRHELNTMLNQYVAESYETLKKNLMPEIENCRAAQLLRNIPLDVLFYNIMAGTGYEPKAYDASCFDNRPVDPGKIIRLVFAPLVTEIGAAQLAEFLDNLQDSEEPGSQLNNTVVRLHRPQ